MPGRPPRELPRAGEEGTLLTSIDESEARGKYVTKAFKFAMPCPVTMRPSQRQFFLVTYGGTTSVADCCTRACFSNECLKNGET